MPARFKFTAPDGAVFVGSSTDHYGGDGGFNFRTHNEAEVGPIVHLTRDEVIALIATLAQALVSDDEGK
jgi:hypothetical protein